MESVTIVTEPLLHRDFVQFEVVVPILEQLANSYQITLAAPRIAPEVREELERRGIRTADGGARFPPIRRGRDEVPSFIASWTRDALWGMNRRDIERALAGIDGIRVNVSMTTAIDADVWIVQSRPLQQGLDAIRKGVNLPLRLALGAANPFVGRLDLHHILDAGRRARERYTTTQHVADWFASNGLPVRGVMPMYYRPTIHRTTTNPSRDYILVYVGKETDSTALRMLLETGLPVTMFGSKSVGWVMNALRLNRYPHARLLGYVSDEELSALYSNARFTAFPFTEEPFGLVPLESMACGTPVLTYNEQGPSESVIDGRTGWLVRSPQEFVQRAVELWNAGFPSAHMVDRCQARSRSYQLDTVRAGWHDLIETAFESSTEGASASGARPWVRPEPSLGVVPSVRSFSLASDSYRPVTGRDPSLRPNLPTFPLGDLAPAISESPASLSRSGGYFDSPEQVRRDSEVDPEFEVEPVSDPREPVTSREFGRSGPSSVPHRVTPEGTAPSTV